MRPLKKHQIYPKYSPDFEKIQFLLFSQLEEAKAYTSHILKKRLQQILGKLESPMKNERLVVHSAKSPRNESLKKMNYVMSFVMDSL